MKTQAPWVRIKDKLINLGLVCTVTRSEPHIIIIRWVDGIDEVFEFTGSSAETVCDDMFDTIDAAVVAIGVR